MATTLTSKDLGPLADFVGTWSGDKGVNLVMVPKVVPGGGEGFSLLENHYRETITFSPLEGLVANRGGQTQQWVAGLKYDLVVTDITKNVPIHIENGMILYLDHVETQPVTSGQVDQFGKPVSNGPFTPLPFPVVRQASIPHGNTIAAPARVIVSQGPPPFNSTGLQTLLSANIENLPPLNDHGIGYASGVQPHLSDGLKALEAEIQNITNSKHTFGNMTTIIFDTANPNGSLVNIDFENKTTSSKFVPTRFQAIFWLEEIIDAHGHKSLVLQYGQRTDFLFNQAQNQTVDQGLILWPHINVNTLTKVLHSPHK